MLRLRKRYFEKISISAAGYFVNHSGEDTSAQCGIDRLATDAPAGRRAQQRHYPLSIGNRQGLKEMRRYYKALGYSS